MLGNQDHKELGSYNMLKVNLAVDVEEVTILNKNHDLNAVDKMVL